MNKNKLIAVDCVGGKHFVFIGHYCREMEKEHWHYYKGTDGSTYHFRKEHIIAVTEKDNTTVYATAIAHFGAEHQTLKACEALNREFEAGSISRKLAIAVKALKNIIDGNDLACERGQSMASWMDSDFRRQAKDALKEIQG